MAHEVGAVRPGVGVNRGVQDYLLRRMKKSRLPMTIRWKNELWNAHWEWSCFRTR